MVVCAEAASLPRNASAAAKTSHARGLLAALVEDLGAALVQPSPQEVKQAVCGRKDASKDDVEAAERVPGAAAGLDGLKRSVREHAADAVGAVLASLHSEPVVLARRLAA